MKRIEAIIAPFELDRAYEALTDDGIHGITVSEVKTSTSTPQAAAHFRGRTYHVNFVSRMRIEVLVEDYKVPQVVATIRMFARTDADPDARIFVIPIGDVIRVRTGERGSAAL